MQSCDVPVGRLYRANESHAGVFDGDRMSSFLCASVKQSAQLESKAFSQCSNKTRRNGGIMKYFYEYRSGKLLENFPDKRGNPYMVVLARQRLQLCHRLFMACPRIVADMRTLSHQEKSRNFIGVSRLVHVRFLKNSALATF